MDEIELKRWERHLAKPIEVEIVDDEGNKDKILLKPLGMEYIGDLLFASNVSIEMANGKQENIVKGTEVASKLILETLKMSYPEISEDVLKGITKKHFFTLLNGVFEVNRFGSKTAKVEEKLDKIRKLNKEEK